MLECLAQQIEQELEWVVQEICDDLCKYRETCDDELICDYMREHDMKCPLSRLF